MWKHVRGREPLIQAFDRVIRSGRLAHAYLFTGPPGVGKRLFATELAKALLCEAPNRTRLEACDACPACAQVMAGTHPDLFILRRPDEVLELPVKLVRDFCQSFGLKPARGRGKVGIVDDADDFNEESANTFLKTLEEPPPRSLILLIGTSTDLQLPTIVSRCQVIAFPPLSDATVRDLLREQGLEDEALLDRLVRLGGGSPGQALALAEPALWEFRRTLIDGLVQRPCDSVGLAHKLTEFIEEAGKEAAAQRGRASQVFRLLIEFLSAALALAVGREPAVVEPADRRAAEELARRLDPDQVLDLLDRCLEADTQVDRRVQLVLVLEALLDALGQKLK